MVAGRQRDFEIEEALEKAMLVFWKKGYLGASLTDLTTSMGINKPSMYAAFGNKEALFVAAAAYYGEKVAAPLFALLREENKSLQYRLKNYLRSTAELLCDVKTPRGCFITVASNELAAHSLPDKAQNVIVDATNCSEEAFEQFFAEEMNKDYIDKNTNLKDLTLFMLTVLHGQAAMARNGKSLEQLYQAIDFSMLSFNEILPIGH